MNEWNIQSRAHACQACGKSFVDKEVYHTQLMTHKHELQRLDICQSCWEAEQAKTGTDADRKGFISNWHAHYHAPPAAPADAIQKESAETLLRKLIEANDPKHGPACYILAVMLERKRTLKIKEQFKRDGMRVFVYEQPKTGDIFTITDPNLQLNQLDEVQRDVSDLLAHGLPASATPPAAEPVAAAEQPAAPADTLAQPGASATELPAAEAVPSDSPPAAPPTAEAPGALEQPLPAEISESPSIHESGLSNAIPSEPHPGN